jgi:hypothetical protein
LLSPVTVRDTSQNFSERVFLVLGQINFFALRINIEQKNWNILTTVESNHPVSAAFAFSRGKRYG